MTQITIIGNITAAPELRFTQGGKAVANVTVAVNRKKGDEQETDFYRVTVWEQMAEHAAQLEKGTRVIVVGRLASKQYENREGVKQTGWEVTADAFGPDLRFQTAQVSRAGDRPQDRAGQPVTPSTPDEPWSTPGGAQNASWPTESPF